MVAVYLLIVPDGRAPMMVFYNDLDCLIQFSIHFFWLQSCLGHGHSNMSHRNLLTSSTYAIVSIGRLSSSQRDTLLLLQLKQLVIKGAQGNSITQVIREWKNSIWVTQIWSFSFSFFFVFTCGLWKKVVKKWPAELLEEQSRNIWGIRTRSVESCPYRFI